ncbi:MAG: alpha/beta hydrolase [Actinobacteria bacterium]|nr:alpha/beta hydrolase [Actinomycetota bacterium]
MGANVSDVVAIDTVHPTRITSTDGVEIAVHDLGGEGPTLVLAHATGFCAGAYRPVAARLASRFHVVALDFRGHGDSTGPADGSFDWTGMVDDVLAVTAVLDGPLVAFGHSMGGACVLAAERRVPGTFDRAFVFEPIVVPDAFADTASPGSNPLAASARRRRATFPSRSAALDRYASRPPLGVFRADALWSYVDGGFEDTPDGEVTLKCRPEVEASVFEATGKILASHLADVPIPVTLAIGLADPGPGPADFGRHAIGFLPDGTLLEYPRLGHFGPFQDPDLVAEDALRSLA